MIVAVLIALLILCLYYQRYEFAILVLLLGVGFINLPVIIGGLDSCNINSIYDVSAPYGYKTEALCKAVMECYADVPEIPQYKTKFIELKASRGYCCTRDQGLTQVYAPWCKMNNIYMDIDGYNPIAKLGFEYQGSHHYDKKGDNYESIVEKDEAKKQVAKSSGVSLIIIHEDVPRIFDIWYPTYTENKRRLNSDEIYVRYIKSRLLDLGFLRQVDKNELVKFNRYTDKYIPFIPEPVNIQKKTNSRNRRY
jgi:hypothetical protein